MEADLAKVWTLELNSERVPLPYCTQRRIITAYSSDIDFLATQVIRFFFGMLASLRMKSRIDSEQGKKILASYRSTGIALAVNIDRSKCNS